MSDDSTSGWTPPQQPEPSAGQIPPPPPSGPVLPSPGSAQVPPPPPPPNWSAAAAGDAAGDGSSAGPIGERSGSSSKKILIGAVVGVLAIGAAGVFAVTQMSGGNTGGAASPEELGEAFMEAVDQEDVLGAIDLLLPGERDTFSEPVQELVNELKRFEVLSDEASLDDVSGLDVTLEDRRVEDVGTNVDDIVNITMLADATATVNGEELPIGELVTETFGTDMDMGDFTASESGLDFRLPMTAVEQDGRWYLSYFYTVAEGARGDADIPPTGIEPSGGDSPEGAIDAMLAGVENLDLTAIVASLNPNEAEALQRYAPLFIGEAQQALDEIPATLEVTDIEYDVEGSGSTRSVSIVSMSAQGTVEEGGESVTASAAYADGCLTVEAQGESFDTCLLQSEGDDLPDMIGQIDGLEEFRATFEDILSDYDQPGITVKEVDGQWYVSPIATYFDQLFAVTNAIDREEIDRATEAIEKFFTSAQAVVTDEYDDLYGDIEEFEDVPASTVVVGEIPVDTVPETDETLPEDDGLDPADVIYQDCMMLPTAEEAAACLQAAVDAGTMPDYYMPIELRFLECGVGDVLVGIVPEYELTDEEYTAVIVKANECFTALVAQGAIEDFEVPADYLRPECAEGRNPWNYDAPDQQELFDRWLDCIYAE